MGAGRRTRSTPADPAEVVYALDALLGLTGTPTASDLSAAMEGHIVGQAELTATYTRNR